MTQNCVKHAKWDSSSARLQTTGDYKLRPHLKEGLQMQEAKKRWEKVLYMHSRKTKATDEDSWGPGAPKKEVGRVWVDREPPGMPELQPEQDCRDLLAICVNSGMSPHCSLKLLSHASTGNIPPQEGETHIIYHVFCFLYIQQNIWVCDGSEGNKNNADSYTTSWEQSPAIFSRMRALKESTGLCAVCVLAQGRSTTGLFSVSPTLRWNRTLTYSEQAPSFRPPGERREEDWVLTKQTKFQMRHSGQDVSLGLKNFHPVSTSNPRK